MTTAAPAPEGNLSPHTASPATAPRSSRLGATWVALGAFTVVLVLLIVFILENSAQVRIEYFGASGHLQLGILVLLGAAAGIVLTLLLGSLRILQLKLRQRSRR